MTVLWLVVVLAFAVALGREHAKTDCRIQDSTYGERHWQWSPPGTYCTVSGSAAADWPASGAPPGWRHARPPHSRTVLAEVLIATGVGISIAWLLQGWKLRKQSE